MLGLATLYDTRTKNGFLVAEVHFNPVRIGSYCPRSFLVRVSTIKLHKTLDK